MIRGKDVALTLLVVGSAAAVGYVLSTDRSKSSAGTPKACLGARIVDEVPDDASVVDISSRRLGEIPRARRTIDRAIRTDAREEWAHVTLAHDEAWTVVDEIRRSLPYHEANNTAYNGVYVYVDGTIVVLDAIGWARLEEPVS